MRAQHRALWLCVLATSPIPSLAQPFGSFVYVDATTPYAEGYVSIDKRILYGTGTDEDTVAFSYGDTVAATTYYDDFSLAGTNRAYLLFLGQASGQASYRWTAGWVPEQHPGWPLCGYANNPDSVWENATQYPDSSLPVDTLPEPKEVGICCYAYCQYLDGCGGTLVKPNVGSIVYFHAAFGVHAKLQVAHVVVETTGVYVVPVSGDTCPMVVPRRLEIRWAVDSAGNGLFKHEVGVRPQFLAAQNRQPASLRRRYFTLNGKRVRHGCGQTGASVLVEELSAGARTLTIRRLR
jgi:hypothetical protein